MEPSEALALLLEGARQIRQALDELSPPPDSPMGHLQVNINQALETFEAGQRGDDDETGPEDSHQQ